MVDMEARSESMIQLDYLSATLLFVPALIFAGGILAALDLRRDNQQRRTKYVWECDRCGFDTWGESEADAFYWHKVHIEECEKRDRKDRN